MNTNLRNCSSVLFVEDIEISKRFYTETLGLVIEMDFGKNVILRGGVTIWEVQEKHIIPLELGVSNIRNKGINRFELYFETDDLEEISNKVKSRNTRLLHDIHEEPWGQRTIRFFDPDNHLIEIGEPMKVFLGRLHDQGFSFYQISQRTGVPAKDVIELLNA
jgi:catechol 2,3-dioxygenase-like lactoylglutathione lyase family enzyme